MRLPQVEQNARARVGMMATTTRLDWFDGPLAEGLRLYNAEEFFAAHEAWESVWLRSPEPEKTFLQGLIQVTAAFHHLRQNNRLGTMLLLQAALRRLDLYPANFGGISVKLLCDDIREGLRMLEAAEGPCALGSPRMRQVTTESGDESRSRES